MMNNVLSHAICVIHHRVILACRGCQNHISYVFLKVFINTKEILLHTSIISMTDGHQIKFKMILNVSNYCLTNSDRQQQDMAWLGYSPTTEKTKLQSWLLNFHRRLYIGYIMPSHWHGPTANIPMQPDSIMQCLVVMLTAEFRSKPPFIQRISWLAANKCAVITVTRSVGKLGHVTPLSSWISLSLSLTLMYACTQ